MKSSPQRYSYCEILEFLQDQSVKTPFTRDFLMDILCSRKRTPRQDHGTRISHEKYIPHLRDHQAGKQSAEVHRNSPPRHKIHQV
jgi:hypothetical protein